MFLLGEDEKRIGMDEEEVEMECDEETEEMRFNCKRWEIVIRSAFLRTLKQRQSGTFNQ